MTYFPILKARQGELNALSHCYPDTLDELRPIIELHEQDTDQLDERGYVDLLGKSVIKLEKAWPENRPTAYLDAAGIEPDVEDETFVGLTPRLLRRLAELNLSFAPVLRLSDSAPLRLSIAELGPDELCIRVGAEDLDNVVAPLDALAEALADDVGVPVSNVDVVLDFGAIENDGHLAMAARLARFVLPMLASGGWRSVAIGAGAFPVNLSDVSAFTTGAIPRRDLALWESIRNFQLPREIDFSDYAVTHPLLPVGQAFAAPPQIRYTHGSDWLALKGLRTDRRGHAQFYDLCAQLRRELGANITPGDASWGDNYIHEAADRGDGRSNDVGPGNAATWRAIATSHHLAYVVNDLVGRSVL